MKDRGVESNKKTTTFDAVYSVGEMLGHILEQLPELKDVLALGSVSKKLHESVDSKLRKDQLIDQMMGRTINPIIRRKNQGHYHPLFIDTYKARRDRRDLKRKWLPVIVDAKDDLSRSMNVLFSVMLVMFVVYVYVWNLSREDKHFDSVQIDGLLDSIGENITVPFYKIIGFNYLIKAVHELVNYVHDCREYTNNKKTGEQILNLHSFFSRNNFDKQKKELELYFPIESIKKSLNGNK